MSDSCFNGLSEAERLNQRLKRLKTERDCLELAKAIYKFLEAYPERAEAFEGKTITFHVNPKSFEAKQSRKEEK